MPKLIVMRGLPGSGKSTLAEQIQKADENCVRLNKDLLRKMLHFDKFSFSKEKLTNKAEELLAWAFLSKGMNVIVDDTNLNPKVFSSWQEYAKELKCDLELVDLNTPLSECIRRDSDRGEALVGKDVIINMARRYGLYEHTRKDVICDIDGTLCDISDRLHLVRGTEKKDWDAFFANIPNDKPRLAVIQDIRILAESFNIVLVSGRPDNYKTETLEWLKLYGVPFETLIMRKAGDRRDDTIIKKEILENYFQKDMVELVFDDRPRVIRMWRENGLRVVDVGNGVEF